MKKTFAIFMLVLCCAACPGSSATTATDANTVVAPAVDANSDVGVAPGTTGAVVAPAVDANSVAH